MNAKIAKVLRKFAEIEGLNYTKIKTYFLTRSKEFQKLDIENMRIIIKKRREVEKKMANQKTCDRSKQVIADGEEFMKLHATQPEGPQREIDLCLHCWRDFLAFMAMTPAYPAGSSVNAGQPSQPPVPAQPAAPVQPQATEAPSAPATPATPADPANQVQQ